MVIILPKLVKNRYKQQILKNIYYNKLNLRRDNMTLGEKIRNLRNNNNISQDKLAKMLNINRNNLSRIETDKSVPTSDILYNLAKIFNISIDSLLEINKTEENNLQKKVRLVRTFFLLFRFLSPFRFSTCGVQGRRTAACRRKLGCSLHRTLRRYLSRTASAHSPSSP